MRTVEARKTILLVEDEFLIAAATRRTLEVLGYAVITANSGAIAIGLSLGPESPDMILMDIDLGDGPDGTEIARTILDYRDIPVVFLSSHTEAEVVEKTEKITSYGYIVKASGGTVLDASIKMAFRLFEANKRLSESEKKQKAMISNISDVIAIMDEDGIVKYWSPNIRKWFGWRSRDVTGTEAWAMVHPDDRERIRNYFRDILAAGMSIRTTEFRHKCSDGSYKPVELTANNLMDDPVIAGVLLNYKDITERKRAEELVEKRLSLPIQPTEDDEVAFADLFNLKEIQGIQDEFAVAMGVASIITSPDGTPLTAPSNFTRLCGEIIRKTEKGCANCFKSDAAIGRQHPESPIVQECLSGGLWDAVTSITVGGHHVANWFIGQVRDEAQTEEGMRDYAREIGADEASFIEAFQAVPAMSRERFERIAQAFFTLSGQLSTAAWQNIRQTRLIQASREAEAELLRQRNLLSTIVESSTDSVFAKDSAGTYRAMNEAGARMLGHTSSEVLGRTDAELLAGETAAEFRKTDEFVISSGCAQEREEAGTIDGNPRVFLVNKTPWRDGNGEILGVIGVSRDITERKRLEEERELSARFILLVEAPGDFRSRMSDLTASLHAWSGCEAVGIRLREGDDFPYYETRGFPAEFVFKENILRALDPEGKPMADGSGDPVLECMCGEILRGRTDPAKPYFTPRGSYWTNGTTALLASAPEADRPARMRDHCNAEGYESVALIPLRSGSQVFGLLQFNDRRTGRFSPDLITRFENMADSLALALSRRQAEEALRKSESRFRSIFDESPVAIWEEDFSDVKARFDELRRDGVTDLRAWLAGHPEEIAAFAKRVRVIEINQRSVELFGAENAAQLARDLSRYFTEDSFRVFTEELVALDEGKPGFRGEIPHLNSKGERLLFDLIISVPAEHATDLSRVLVSFLDITERKRAEERVESLLEEKDLLLKEVHHRIKNNMNTVMSLLSLQSQNLRDPQSIEALEDAGNRVQSMIVLYDKLYRSEGYRGLSLKEYLEPLAREIFSIFPNKESIRLTLRIEDFFLSARILFPIGMLVNELVTNAMKHAYKGRQSGSLALSASTNGGRVALTVSDDGVGVAPSFDPAAGAGFGMQLVQGLTAQLGGTMKVVRGEGTTFIVEFDREERDAKARG